MSSSSVSESPASSEALLPKETEDHKKRASSWPTFIIVGLSVIVLGALIAATVVAIIIYARVDLESEVDLQDIRSHMVAFDGIARAHNGSRTDESGGFAESAAYIEKVLAPHKNHLVVRRVPFSSVKFEITKMPKLSIVSPVQSELQYKNEFSFAFSASASVGPSPLYVVAGTGCSQDDYLGTNISGRIAFVQGMSEGCSKEQKIANASAAGASALLVALEVGEKPPPVTYEDLKRPLKMHVFFLEHHIAEIVKNIASREEMKVKMEFEWRNSPVKSFNLIAETVAGRKDARIILSAHLDSTSAGPGINDNGSGSAAILEIAKEAASNGLLKRLENQVVFAWWGLEEAGMVGSEAYVTSMNETEKASIAAVINADMIASPNWIMFIGNSSTAPPKAAPGFKILEQMMAKYLNGSKMSYELESLLGGSDMMPFTVAGIPSTYLGCGAGNTKTEEQRKKYGGMANAPCDACYHHSCDDIDNTDGTPLLLFTKAMANAVNIMWADKDLMSKMRPKASTTTVARDEAESWKPNPSIEEIRWLKAMNMK